MYHSNPWEHDNRFGIEPPDDEDRYTDDEAPIPLDELIEPEEFGVPATRLVGPTTDPACSNRPTVQRAK
jgi:hypothetical protein